MKENIYKLRLSPPLTCIKKSKQCHEPDEGGGRQSRDAREEERDGPRLVEHLHRYPLHRTLVYLDEVLRLELRVVVLSL